MTPTCSVRSTPARPSRFPSMRCRPLPRRRSTGSELPRTADQSRGGILEPRAFGPPPPRASPARVVCLTQMKIEATRRAKEFIVEHGGNVYVWSDEDGFDHASTEQPDAQIDFVPTEADG